MSFRLSLFSFLFMSTFDNIYFLHLHESNEGNIFIMK